MPRPGALWRRPQSFDPDASGSEHAASRPAELFSAWLDWMDETVMGFVEGYSEGDKTIGRVPLDQRYIASVRPKTQEDLRADVTWSPKYNDHWNPQAHEVFLTVEEPLNGENVARCVKPDGFWAIRKEIGRARTFFAESAPDDSGLPNFQALLKLKPLSTRQQPANGCFKCGQLGHISRDCPQARVQRPAPWQQGPGAAAGAPHGQKRPLGAGAPQPPAKRPVTAAFGALAQARARAVTANLAQAGVRAPSQVIGGQPPWRAPGPVAGAGAVRPRPPHGAALPRISAPRAMPPWAAAGPASRPISAARLPRQPSVAPPRLVSAARVPRQPSRPPPGQAPLGRRQY